MKMAEEQLKAEEERQQKIREEEEKKKRQEEEEKEQEEDKKRKQREERLKRREENRGDAFQSEDMFNEELDIKEEEAEEIKTEVVTTTTVTTTTTVMTTVERKVEEATKSSTQTDLEKVTGESDLRLTRRTVQQINTGTLYFKLGQDNNYRNYINHYSATPFSISKAQANEERIKRQHMSHKFSLTDAAAFKWNGTIHGERTSLVSTLRQTMLALENNLNSMFMHPNWNLLRKPWMGAVSQSVSPRDFSRALTVLKCCIKPCLMVNVWKDALGHTQLKKITVQMRDDKKKNEKRERKEREDEDERLRPFMTFVKYTLGLKHQVSKQRGEEYRAHGQQGWLWLSGSRNYSPCDSMKQGLRAGPFRLAVKYTDTRDNNFKIVLMEPKAFNYLLSKQEDLDRIKKEEEEELTSLTNGDVNDEDVKDENSIEEKVNDKTTERKKLEQALKFARLARQEPAKDLFEEVVDVEQGLSNPTRSLFPNVAKKAKVIDDFLARRVQLKTLEERRIETKTGKKTNDPCPADVKKIESTTEEKPVDVEGESDTQTTAVTNDIAQAPNKQIRPDSFVINAKKNIWAFISKLKEKASGSGSKSEPLPVEVKKEYLCYSPSCRKYGRSSSCYSVQCKNWTPTTVKVEPQSSEECLEAEEFYQKIIDESVSNGLNVPKEKVEMISTEDAISKLQNLVKILMVKKEEADRESSVGISTITTVTTTTAVTTSETKVNGGTVNVTTSKTESLVQTNSTSSITSTQNGNVVTESETTKSIVSSTKSESDLKTGKTELTAVSKVEDVVRIYSSTDTTGKLYLKRIQSVAESKKQGKVVRYPLAPHFYAKTRQKRNILLLAKHDVKRLSRKAGTVACEGFNYNSKSNNVVWPYPCPRPSFQTTWLYRTASADSIQSVALQLRILWACIRWDDMQTRPPTSDGKHQVTSDSAITTTEIMKHKNSGRFLEKTQYFQRKVTIPLDVPKTRVEVTPIRSGLRKRKRAESPKQSEPQVEEKWVEEEALELWEIKSYRERLERDKLAAMTRSRTGTQIREPQRLDPGNGGDNSKISKRDEANKRLDEQLKQRQLQQSRSKVQQYQSPQSTSSSSNLITVRSVAGGSTPRAVLTPSTPTIIRRVRNPDGSTSLVKSSPVGPPTLSGTVVGTTAPQMMTPTTAFPPGATKKVFISKDGKVIGTQVLQPSPRLITPTAPTLATPTRPLVQLPQVPQAPAAAVSPSQKVQVVQCGDGKLQVRGLLPGQQLMRTPDGKLQILGTPTIQQQPVVTPTSSVTLAASSPASQTPGGPGRIILQPGTAGGSQIVYTGQPAAQPQTPVQPQLPTSPIKIASPGGGQVIATPLAPGSQIPTGMTAFVSGGKTYCIPKATMALANNKPTSPVVSGVLKSPVMSSQLPTTHSTPQQPAPPSGKQMVEVKTLGQNVVSFKGNQMIVSGPDVEQAQAIAKQLSSGQARLATMNGKQVLISTSTTMVPPGGDQQSKSPIVATPKTPTTLIKSEPEPVKLPTEPLPKAQATAPAPTQGPVQAPALDIKAEEPATSEVAASAASEAASASPQQVTAQLVQTPNGPRIILQGIHGGDIPREQLVQLQQQVKVELLKAQSEAKLQGKVPPTKIAITVPSSMQGNQTIKTEIKEEPSDTPTTSHQGSGDASSGTPGSLTNLAPPANIRPVLPLQGSKVILMNNQKVVMTSTPTPAGNSAVSGSNVLLSSLNTSQPPRLLPSAPIPQSQLKGGSLATPASTTAPIVVRSLVAQQPAGHQTPSQTPTTPGTPSTPEAKTPQKDADEKFKLTDDYIQSAIQTALKQNLSPEIERKVLALQQHKDTVKPVTGRGAKRDKKKVVDPETGEIMDDEWDPYAASKLKSSQNRKKKAAPTSASTPVPAPVPTPSPTPPAPTSAKVTPKVTAPVKVPEKIQPLTASPKLVEPVIASPAEKRKKEIEAKLQGMLSRHKDLLRKDIHRKRQMQEKELQFEIGQEIEAARKSQQEEKVEAVQNNIQNNNESESSFNSQPQPHPRSLNSSEASNGKRKRESESDSTTSQSSKRRKRSSSTSGNRNKEKLHCICKTKYDPRKFYVGCDVCNEWVSQISLINPRTPSNHLT